MAKNYKFSLKDIREALREEDGNISRAAKRLGASRRAIYYRIQKADSLQDLLKVERQQKGELRIDLAERNLDKDLEAGERWATKYVLDTLGRKYGYGPAPAGNSAPSQDGESNRQTVAEFIKEIDDLATDAGRELVD